MRRDHDRRRHPARPAACAAAGALLAAATQLIVGCTSSTPQPTTTTQTRISTQTVISTPSAGPIAAGPTTSSKRACPVYGKQAAADTLGMRLDKVLVLTSGGKVVGCEFYAIQNTSLATFERLPGPDQPVLRITASTYPSAIAAHNAMVRLSQSGKNPQQATIGAGNIGLAFQTDFYPADHGADWACAFTEGTRLVYVQTVVTSPALNSIDIAKAVAGKFT